MFNANPFQVRCVGNCWRQLWFWLAFGYYGDCRCGLRGFWIWHNSTSSLPILAFLPADLRASTAVALAVRCAYRPEIKSKLSWHKRFLPIPSPLQPMHFCVWIALFLTFQPTCPVLDFVCNVLTLKEMHIRKQAYENIYLESYGCSPFLTTSLFFRIVG